MSDLYVFSKNNGLSQEFKLCNKIKVFRAEFNLTQSELGNLIGVTRQTISVLEQGLQAPSLPLAVKMACVFNKKIEDIFYYEEEEK